MYFTGCPYIYKEEIIQEWCDRVRHKYSGKATEKSQKGEAQISAALQSDR